MTSRGLRLSVGSAAVFVSGAAALALFGPGSTRHFGAVDLLLVLMFALLARLEYPIGAGSAVPAQLAFVPMLFAMPLRLVPLAVCAGSVLATAIASAMGNRPNLCPNALGACWFTVPPVAILLAAGEQPFAWRHWPLYAAAFLAQCAADLVLTVWYETLANRVSLRPLLQVLWTVYSFDALLTPIALVAASEGGYAFLALVPFTGVLYLLGRERRSRLSAQSEADRLHELTHLDDLTRVANRRHFDERLGVERARAVTAGTRFSVCLLDLDHFKQYNDTHGHPAGDDLLRRVSDRWAATLRTQDLLARIGGEEFGLILPEAGIDVAESVVERLRPITPDEITVSAGVASWNGEETVEQLIARADAALYRAKREGRDRSVLAA